jgi:DNA polymerase-3 subunit delta'
MLEDVVGQPEAVAFLKAIEAGKCRTPLLLFGSEGVGRKFSIQCLARSMFCVGTKTSDCKCVHCTQILVNQHPDLVFVHPPDGKDFGVDSSREIVEDSGYAPTTAPYKIFFVDGAERFTPAAANALLKTLEETPAHVRFFLSTTSLDDVIPTIRSRCWAIRYKKLPENFVLSVLQRFESAPAKALVYARLSDGSPGIAVGLWGSRRLKLRDKMVGLLKECLSGDASRIFAAVEGIQPQDLDTGVSMLIALVRDILLVGSTDSRLVNQDAVEAITDLRGSMREGVAESLWDGLRGFNRLPSSVKGGFHLKTLLARNFI